MKREEKACTKCKEVKQATPEYFSRNKNKKDGLASECKVCASKRMKEYRERNKEAWNKRSLEYYHKNKEERQAYNKEWAEKNKKHRQEYMKQWKEENKEHLITYMYHYRLENLDAIREKDRKWREKNPEYSRISTQRRNAMKEGLLNDLTEEEWEDTLEYFDNGCAYCGDSESGLQQEHVIPISKGGPYTQENIIPACKSCNSSKKDRDLEEWYVSYRHYDEERLNKVLDYVEIIKGVNNYE